MGSIFDETEAAFEAAREEAAEKPTRKPVPVRATLTTGAENRVSTPEDGPEVVRNQYGQTPAEVEALRLELRRMWEPDPDEAA